MNKIKHYIVESLRLGGKQMLCDIIKWTIIIIIAAIVFTIVYNIVTPKGRHLNRPIPYSRR